MAALTVLRFASPAGAYAAMVRLESLPGEEQPLQDADVVSWEAEHEKPTHHALYNTKKAGELSGGFWGLLFGVVFPVLGPPPGAASEAPLPSHEDIGISDSFISDVRDKVTPGTSALFIFASDHAVLDRAADTFRDTDAEIIRTSLSKEHEARLREAFARD